MRRIINKRIKDQEKAVRTAQNTAETPVSTIIGYTTAERSPTAPSDISDFSYSEAVAAHLISAAVAGVRVGNLV